jgi:hypothetical protein
LGTIGLRDLDIFCLALGYYIVTVCINELSPPYMFSLSYSLALEDTLY